MTRWRPFLFTLAAVLGGACGPPLPIGDGGSEPPGEDADAGSPISDGGLDAGFSADGGDGGPTLKRITSITVSPGSIALRVGAVSGLTATATFDDGSSADISGTVTWTATPAGVVQVQIVSANENLVKLEALAEGQANVIATTGGITSNPCSATVTLPPAADAGVVPTEVRAVWVTRFAYNSASEVRTIIDQAASSGFNVLYFQIRGSGDAYYRSTLVPWAKKLSGTLGKDPGWDPLQVAIDQAHLRGIELHAYWNVYSAWSVPSGCSSTGSCTCQPTQGLADSCQLPEASPAGMPEHVLRAHPEYLAVTQSGKSIDTEYYWLSPGNPAVKAHLVAAASELLTHYAVDGLHFDRVRYPGQGYSHDAASLAAYAALPSPAPSYADWQRLQVNDLVGQIYSELKQKRPKAVLSAAVWPIYKPLPGCNTSQGFGNYYQDPLAWMKAAQIDAITPMIYWGIGTGCTDWSKLLDGFLVGSNGRPVVAGMHALDSSVPQPAKMKARIEYARKVGAAGTAIFASTYLNTAPQGGPTGSNTWSTFRADGGPYREDAGTPPITWR